MKRCGNDTLPTTDDSAIECDGEFISTSCVVTSVRLPYLGVSLGDYQSDINGKIVVKFKSIDNNIDSLDRKVIELEADLEEVLNDLSNISLEWIPRNLLTFSDNSSAISGGLNIGDYYTDNNGFVKKVI